MDVDPRTPVIVGVGQVNVAGQEAPEPVDLLAHAARQAGVDSGAQTLLASVESIRVVKLLSWRYRDPGALLAARIGAAPRHTAYSTDSGHTPQLLLNGAALDIQQGRADAILLGGAESWRTRMGYRKRGERPQWTRQPEGTAPTEIIGAELDMNNEVETKLGVFMPVQVYPMFESALRHARGVPVDQHTRNISELWAGFSQVAAANRYAALPKPVSAHEIATPSPTNRMIGFPYTKLMNSNNSVNQAAAILLCSLERARAAGVAEDRMVFPLSGSEAADTKYVSHRADLSSSPAIRFGGRAALEAASIGIDDVAHIDLYSCFPSAVQIGAMELGIGAGRPLTVTGGLTFAGGPWNNYVTHGIATMVDVLRRDGGGVGLCSANGGLLTKHAFGVYSSTPPERPFRVVRPDFPLAESAREVVDETATGPAVIEAYTVMHDGTGAPELAILTALRPDGTRAWRTSHDADLVQAMTSEEFCGRALQLAPDGQLDLV